MDETERTEELKEPEQIDTGADPAEDPGDFSPIYSQAEFDERIKRRLERQRAKLEKEFAERSKAAADPDELEQLREQNRKQDEMLKVAAKENAELKAAKQAAAIRDLKLYQAKEYDIPLELIDNITGTTEKEIRKSAETLAGYVKRSSYTIPGYNYEPGGSSYAPKRSTKAAALDMLRDLDLENKGGMF